MSTTPVTSPAVQEETPVREPARATPRARARRRPTKGFDRPRVLWVVTGLTLLFLALPLVVVLVFSFNGGTSLARMDGLSLRWYKEALNDGDLRASLWMSIRISLIATAIATFLGVMLAFGLQRAHRKPARAVDGVIGLALVSPETATAIALLLVFTQLGITLSTTTLIAGHVALCLSFVTVVVRSRMRSINDEVEQAAMDLGATRLQALRLVALPMLWPSILAAAMLAFVLSFDNFITSFFTSGIGTPPLPVRIYAMIRFGVTPVVNALGVLMVVLTAAATIAALVATRIGRRRSASSAS